MARPNGDEDDDFFDRVEEMAEHLGMKGREKEQYIHEHMTRGGYRRVQSRDSYKRVERNDEEEERGSGFFNRGGRDRGRRRNDDDDRF